MKTYLSAALLISVIIITGCNNQRGTEYNLYYLGGQSNMEGYGYCSELPDSYTKVIDDILVFHRNTSPDGEEPDGKGIWSPLRSGHGGGVNRQLKVHN